MEKPLMHSKDMVASNIEAIAALFPNCVTERKDANGKVTRGIDFEKLQQELSSDIIERGEERYQFTWPGKMAVIREANTPTNSALRPDVDGSEDFWNTKNLYIEGDNLEVLKLLQEDYLGKVKMIYIDPPYNTGNDFVYNDDFAESSADFSAKAGMYDEEGNMLLQNYEKNSESNGRFHTDWLNMMYPRLKVARNLLSEDGVIFISIDDNEVENLKKVASEIFGQNNFITQLVWEKKKKGSFLSNNITCVKEYILVYSKDRVAFKGLIGEINSETETYPCVNAANKREIRHIPSGIVSKYKEKDFFMPKGSEISDTTMSLVLHSDLVIRDYKLAEDLIIEGNWRYSQQAMRSYAEADELYITRDLYLRRIVSDTRYKTLKDLLSRVGDNEDVTCHSSIDITNLSKTGWGSNEDADEELRLLFGVQKLLDYPKPVRLIYKLLASFRPDKNCIVIDFFSGSATAAHATLKYNADNNCNIKYIMVQLPELTEESSEAYKAGYKNICEIGKERIRRAGKKIKDENPTAAELDTGFRVLKLADSNMKQVYYTPLDTKTKMEELQFDTANNIKDGRTDLDLLFQVMLEKDVTLDAPIRKEVIQGHDVYFVDDTYLVAAFGEKLPEELIKELAKMQPFNFVMANRGLADDSMADNFEQIFKAYSPDTNCMIL